MQQLFSTPLFTYEGVFIPYLLEEIVSLHSTETEWRSPHDFLQREGACGELNKKFVKVARAMINEMNWSWAPPRKADGWINVNPPGSFIAPHRHKGADLCGTYYVCAPKDCGELELQSAEGTTPFKNVHRVEPKVGMFVMFPGYLSHWVRPNRSSETRISVSWNLAW